MLAGTSGRGVFVIENGAVREFPTSPRPLFVNSLAGGSLWMGTDAAKGMSGVYLDKDDSKAVRITAPTAKVLTLEERRRRTLGGHGTLWPFSFCRL